MSSDNSAELLVKSPSTDEIFGETGRTKGSSPVKYGSKPKVGGVYKSPGSYSTRPPATPRKRARLQSDSEDEDGSILSPLSSLPPTPSTKHPSSPTKYTKAVPPLSRSGSGSTGYMLEEPWRIDALGDYVWILVDQMGRPFEPGRSEFKTDLLWWPAKITSNLNNSVTVAPYGDLTTSVSTIRVKSPSAENILALTNSLGRPRFDYPSFVTPETTISLQGSPQKKRKRDRQTLETKWHDAVSKMLREKEEHIDDGLPPIEFALSASSRYASASAAKDSLQSLENSGSPTSKGKGKASALNDGLDKPEDDRWSPPPADMTLTIPGELILARDRAEKNSLHWPAKILGYVPPPRAKVKTRQKDGKYRIEFLDESRRDVPRDWFYACHQEEFGTCQMGQFESEYADNPDDDSGPDSGLLHNSSRSPSPITPSQHPSTSSFTDLSIREQFTYTKPVLQAILNEEFKPARERHDRFMKGGGARESLAATAGLRGKMDPQAVNLVQEYLSNWCLRDEVRGRKIVLEGECEGQKDSGALDANASLLSKGLECVEVRDDEAFKENVVPYIEGIDKRLLEEAPKASLVSSPTTTVIELAPSSPAPIPPTSSAPSSSDVEVSDVEYHSDTTERGVASNVKDPTETSITGSVCTLSRQKGCEAYEELAGVEKLAYCLNVLLPEAILQILLWRNCLRTSTHLLSDTEEEALHEKGQKLVEETDWVFDVVRLREMKAKQVRDRQKAEQVQGGNTSATNGLSRLRRNSRSTVSRRR